MDVLGWAVIALLLTAWLVLFDGARGAIPVKHRRQPPQPAPSRPVARRPRRLWLDYELAVERRSDAELRSFAAGKAPAIVEAVENIIAQRRRASLRRGLGQHS